MVIHDDALNYMSTMYDDSVDVTITSPPYNMNLRIRNGKYCSRQIVKELTTKYKSYDDNLPMADYFEFNRQVISELLRVTKHEIFYNVQFLTGNKVALYQLIGCFAEQLKEFIVWDKVNAEPAIGEGVLNSRWEALLVFSKRDAISRKFSNAQFERGTVQNLWQIKRGKKVSPDHGAVFPIELVESILTNFVPAQSTVFDPFMGTGTTGVACKKHGCSFIGVEKDYDYHQFATQRIDHA